MKYCTVCQNKYDDGVSFCSLDGEVLEDDPTSFVGSVLDGQYQIESLLGKGGMGAVYLARHILLGDRVAIKILPPEVRNNAEWLRRFRREGQAARRFRHANAVTVYDLRTASDGTIYMVMEYVEGHTLDAELKRRGHFTPAETLEILEPIMSVLNTAHAMGVVHRDLKPENIMIGKSQTNSETSIKLLDLGIAKMREIAGVESAGTTELTMAGQVLGTPYYMSPEQWGELSRDGNPEIDGRTDIYSLGLVAYQMISGSRAYAAATLHELRRDHLSVMPPPLAEKVPGVPQEFSKVISRAISKDRSDRQSTAGELAAQLREGLGDSNGQLSSAERVATPAGPSRYAQTQGTPGAVATNSDVNAATIVTSDAIPTSPPNIPQLIPAAARQPEKSAAVAAVDDLQSVVTVMRPAAPTVEPKKSRGKTLALAGGGVLLLAVIVLGVGGVFALKWFKTKPAGDAINAGTTKTSKANDVLPEKPAGTPSEFGRYWLEVLPKEMVTEPKRVAGNAPLKSGDAFKFHFSLAQNGFLYIVGPGEGNRLTAFLTNTPATISGLESNQVAQGADFSFPDGIEHWLELDKKAGTDNYTIIFSPVRLEAPAFLNAEATGNPISDSEESEFHTFVAKFKTSAPVTEIDTKNSSKPFVTVKVPPTENSGAPVIFEILIQHK